MVHKPKHKVHSFRGLLGDGGQDEINLERQNVNLAYRIVKFEFIPNDITTAADNVLQIWREEQTSVPTSSPTIDFDNTDLLGAVYYNSGKIVLLAVFDLELFSRNIYVTHTDHTGSTSANYYIEIEEVPVNAAALMQLKLQVARKLNLQQD